MRLTLVFLFIINSSFIFAQAKEADSTKPIKRRFLVLPIVINSPETKIGAGLVGAVFFRTKHKDTSIRTSNIEVVSIYTQRNQLVVQTGSSIYFPHENYIIRWYGSYANFPDKFWGIGNNTPESNKEVYSYQQIYLSTQLMRRVYKRLFLGIDYELQDLLNVRYDRNGIFDLQNVPGRNGSIASGVGPLIAWDSRNNAFSPNKGEFLQFSIKNYGSLTGSQYNFANYSLDFRKFIRSFKYNVFAFQILAQATSGTVPFRELPTIGGPFMMRGYYLGRFRDKDLLAGQAEYRLHVWKRFGLVGFAGIGEVSSNVKNFYFNGLKYSLGGGIRFAIIPKEKLNVRLDYAIGNKGSSGLYLYIMEAF